MVARRPVHAGHGLAAAGLAGAQPAGGAGRAVLASFAAPALLAGLRSPQALVFGIGMLLPLAVVLLVVLLTADAGKPRALSAGYNRTAV